ncbi:MHYT domain-containing protein [Marinomonas profundimaris]|nr:MHYT domain-containing protein [Marinomonas profundimaris]
MISDYNYWLVALSIALAAMASFFALHFASVAQHIVIEKYKSIALVSGSFIMAGGIWSMHFVGMLAFDMGHTVSYDPYLTVLSLIPSILASYITLKRLIKPNLSIWQLLLNGVLVGGGIGAMHYIGMEAMEMHVELRYDPAWFIFSIVIAVVLAFIAISTQYYVGKIWTGLSQKWVSCISALIMGAAISGMHYAGMAGARFISIGGSDMSHMSTASNSYLSFVVATITLLLSILASNIASQLRYRQLLLEKTASEVRLKTTLDTAVDGIITIDSHGIIKEFNKAASSIFGWQEKDIINQPFDRLFLKKHTEEFHAFLGIFRDTGETNISGTEREICALNNDGQTFPIRIGVGRVDIIGDETLFVAFISDISTRKAMEETIRKSEKQFSSLIKNIPGASFRCLMDEHWTALFVSDAIYDVAGWMPSDFYDNTTSFSQLIHPDDLKFMLDPENESSKNKTYSVEYRLKHKDGDYVWVLENGSIIHNDAGEAEWIDGVILDISQRIEMENELRLAKQKAEESAESKASFLANMSHEIRTPMNAIIGFSDILLDSDVSGDNKKHLATISKSARSLLHLLNDILDSAKLEKNKLELDIQVFVLANMVDTVISTLWLQARNKGLALNFEIETEVEQAFLGAEDRIRQVLMNILGNAIKFTEKGYVTLTVSKNSNHSLRFSVQDSGIGIPAERMKSIFDPFTQADASMSRRFGGTGLGTSISKQLITLMGGELHAESVLGVGSCFYFDLPLEVSEAPPEATLSQLPVIKEQKILIADDIEQNLTLLTLLLKRQGHTVFLAKDGIEAIEQFKTIKPDLILMDIQMPNMDGLMATQIIRQYEKENQRPHTPVIALTANVLVEDKLEAQQSGMDGFANKPIDIHALVAEMARVLKEPLVPAHQEKGADIQTTGVKNTQINISKGLSLWLEMPLYITELSTFSSLNSDLPKRLSDYLSIQAYDDIHALAHAVKGTSGNLALLNISNVMATIERAAQKKNRKQCEKGIQWLTSSLTEFFTELSQLADKSSSDEQSQPVDYRVTLSKTGLLSLLNALMLSANSGEIDDEKIELLIRNVPQSMKIHAIEISKAIANFDFDSAVTTLTQLKVQIAKEADK